MIHEAKWYYNLITIIILFEVEEPNFKKWLKLFYYFEKRFGGVYVEISKGINPLKKEQKSN